MGWLMLLLACNDKGDDSASGAESDADTDTDTDSDTDADADTDSDTDTDTDSDSDTDADSAWSWGTVNTVANADASIVAEAMGDYAGACLSNAGDVNGDGDDDIAIGAPWASTLTKEGGAVYLVRGGPGPWKIGMSLADFPSVAGDVESEQICSSVSVGDLNGDGMSDLAISDGFQVMGMVPSEYLMLGSEDPWDHDLAASAADVIASQSPWAPYLDSRTYGRIGDIDGDGDDDWMIGSTFGNGGEVNVISGQDVEPGPLSYPDDAVLWMYGDEGVVGGGAQYAPFGDVTGDGAVDLFVWSTEERGIWIVAGGASLPYDTEPADAALGTINGEPGDAVWAGPLGDIDSDGIDDFMVAHGPHPDENDLHVFFGGDDFSGPIEPDDGKLTITGDSMTGVGSVPDLDGDGLAELVIGSFETSLPDSYDFMFVRGEKDWPAELAWEDGDTLLAAGRPSAPMQVGDLNGDGLNDLVLPDQNADIGTADDAGGIDVWLGRETWPTTLSAKDVDVRFEGTFTFQTVGRNMLVMDLDGDDYDDILTTTPYEDEKLEFEGTTYIFFGQP